MSRPGLMQRFDDWQRERRIKRLAAACLDAGHRKDFGSARRIFEEMRSECLQRSPGQISRMERRIGVPTAERGQA